jgi:hypothetical protein
MDLVKPYVNLNGTSRADLIRQHADVANAARFLLEVLVQSCPHGRDYTNSPRDRGDINEAREAYHERWRIVALLEEEYMQMAIALQRGDD